MKYYIITGGNAGLGYACAEKLLATEHEIHLVLACRNQDKAQQAVTDLRKAHPDSSSHVEAMALDLNNPESVRQFAADYIAKATPLHILLCNGGVYPSNGPNFVEVASLKQGENSTTKLEVTFATNYLGHFYLTLLLLPLLRKSASESGIPSRIVNVSSELHRYTKGPVDFDNLDYHKRGTYSGQTAYAISKLALMYFTYSLSKLLSDHGEPQLVTVNACTPGFVPATNMARKNSWFHWFISNYVLTLLPFARTVDDGVGCMLACTRLEDNITGVYLKDRQVVKSSDESYNSDNWDKCWDWSCNVLGIDSTKAKAVAQGNIAALECIA